MKATPKKSRKIPKMSADYLHGTTNDEARENARRFLLSAVSMLQEPSAAENVEDISDVLEDTSNAVRLLEALRARLDKAGAL